MGVGKAVSDRSPFRDAHGLYRCAAVPVVLRDGGQVCPGGMSAGVAAKEAIRRPRARVAGYTLSTKSLLAFSEEGSSIWLLSEFTYASSMGRTNPTASEIRRTHEEKCEIYGTLH